MTAIIQQKVTEKPSALNHNKSPFVLFVWFGFGFGSLANASDSPNASFNVNYIIKNMCNAHSHALNVQLKYINLKRPFAADVDYDDYY